MLTPERPTGASAADQGVRPTTGPITGRVSGIVVTLQYLAYSGAPHFPRRRETRDRPAAPARPLLRVCQPSGDPGAPGTHRRNCQTAPATRRTSSAPTPAVRA